MNSVKLTRREIREKALQALYPFDFNQELTKSETIRYALEYNQEEIISEDQEEFIPQYLDQLVSGVCEHQKELDEKIQANLRGWSLPRLAKTDVIIMRIAIYEMLYVEDVPTKVALNEAVELTKKYSDDKSRKFVNGVLSNVAKIIEEA